MRGIPQVTLRVRCLNDGKVAKVDHHPTVQLVCFVWVWSIRKLGLGDYEQVTWIAQSIADSACATVIGSTPADLFPLQGYNGSGQI